MKLSVITINQNSCKLLKQALNSIVAAGKHIDYELIAVNNGSVDRSAEMLAADFPQAKVIANETNLGTTHAINQALKFATGEYVLVVSPDMLSNKDSLEKMVAFMDEHNDVGGLAVRMLSPKGRFLPESIHGLTTSWAAFLKLIGFAKNLPKTRLYDRNRKDWVEEFQIAEIDILNAGCMLLRRSVLNATGEFDERFVMFGHNVDMSYRIRLAGYKNYYFPKTYFINFESQPFRKMSWAYVKYYYGAMVSFAIKYLFKMPEIKVTGIPALAGHSYEVK